MDTIIRAASLGAGPRLLRRATGVAPVPAAPAAVAERPQALTATAPAREAGTDAHDAAARIAQAQGAARQSAELAAQAQARLAELEARDKQREAEFAEREKSRQQELVLAQSKLQAEIEASRVEAQERGYRAGLVQGERAAADALAEEVERLRNLGHALGETKGQLLADAEDLMVEIAFGAICRVLGAQAASRETLLALVREAGCMALERERVTVRLHPDDAALLEDECGNGPTLVVGDRSVVLGGCLVDSPTGTLDMRLEIQVAALADALAGVRAGRRAAGVN